jgi:hypothetical protein
MTELPGDARASVVRIEAMLEEARRLASGVAGADEAAFALKETERRYLPDTLAAYLDIPASQRDAAAAEMVVGQLQLLERATAQRLATLTEASRTTLAANGAFLSERFGALETLPEAPALPAPSPADAPPRALVARFFSELEQSRGTSPATLVNLAAERFGALLPALTTVKRGLFGGPARSVFIDVPSGDHVFRYALEAGRAGVETTCTKVVRGIALRTERCDLGEWLHGLYDDVGAYAERDRSTRDTLTSFFSR